MKVSIVVSNVPLTSNVWLIAAPRSKTRRTSPVLRLVCHANDKLRMWSNARVDMANEGVSNRQ